MTSLRQKSKHSRMNFMNNIMDDTFHPQKPICQIIQTTRTRPREDLFKKYRPARGTCADYNISQTDTKLDAGDTKIHVQETVAEYEGLLLEPPPPPPPKKVRYFSGGPPQWQFLEEKWRIKVEKMQKIYHQQFLERVAQRKKNEKGALLKKHRKLLALVGPAWYQELSPKQLATVDNLKNCILKDFAEGVTANTQDNIAELGLVLRPNHKHVEKALKNCCKCPVEFLLILYQLINPQRRRYSINDRLLLSAVVHLALKDTLKELHIRIPSPPPPQKIKKIKAKKKKNVRYESPYLEPYTFIRDPPKYTGIYYNKHRQYPENPYFSYLEELNKKIDSNCQSKCTTQVDEEIAEETEYAQTVYEQLVNYRPVPLLRQPSKYQECIKVRTEIYSSNIQSSEQEETDDYLRHLCIEDNEEGDEEEEQYEQDEEEQKVEEEYEGSEHDECGDLCKDASQNYHEEEIEQIISSQDLGTEENVACESTKKTCRCVEKKGRLEKSKEDMKKADEVSKPHSPHMECECKEESRKFIDTPLCQCERCVEERKNKTTTLVIAGMKEEKSKEVIPIIDALIAEQPCECLKDYDKRVGEYEVYQKRKELVYETVKNEEKFVIGGVVNRPEGPVYIISNLLPKYECICHEKAREEEAEKRHLARMPRVPPGRIKYGIGGVKETPQGNVYVIDQTIPIEPCDCMNIYEKFEKEHSACLQLYDDYMNQMQEDITEFVNNDAANMTTPTNKYDITEDKNINVFEENMKKIMEEADRIRPPIKENVSERSTSEVEIETNELQHQSMKKIDSQVVPDEVCHRKVQRKKKSMPFCCCYCGRMKTVECNECTCGIEAEVPCTDCTCGPPVTEAAEVIEEEKQLKRFFIFDKILCNTKWQMKVIKDALKSMADDGYPLAKLPNAWKLPHFKLWMQMRCGKYWTLEDKYKTVLDSKCMWRHCDYCNVRKVPLPELPLTNAEAHLVNWSRASYCRGLVSDGLDKFYSKVRQNTVNYGREFFPSMFEYQLPFPTFRDCYFAYTPSKEEDVLSRFVWQKFEYYNMVDAKHCPL